MNLSREQTLLFIRLLKKHRLLWDPEDPDYIDKVKKRDTWEKIASFFNKKQGTLAYRKYKLLLTTYANLLTKFQCENKIPKWFCFNELNFLRDVVEKRVTELSKMPKLNTTENCGTSASSINLSPLSQNDVDFDYDSDNPFSINQKPSRIALQTSHSFTGHNSEVSSECKLSKLSPPLNISGFYENMEQQLREPISKNEFDSFGAHVSTQLKQLAAIHAMELMYEIQALITQKRILIINRETKLSEIPIKTEKKKKNKK